MDAVFDLLAPQRLTAVVDIGANPIDGDPPYKAMLSQRLCTLVGFEPQTGALAELNRRRGPNERYLPDAVGDGSEATFYHCQEGGMSSLLEPDPERLALFNEFPGFGKVVRTARVRTRRLDDIAEVVELDFLKLDAQGSELNVIAGAARRLAQAVAVQIEISFVPLYRRQPPFGAVDLELRRHGFVPHALAALKLWPIAPTVINGDPRLPVNQLLEGDMIYVRDFTRPENMTGEQWKQLALIAHHCYGSIDLAARAMRSAEQVGAVRPRAGEQYLRLLQSRAAKSPTSRPGPPPAGNTAVWKT
jgi:FkbM family methyltransferase